MTTTGSPTSIVSRAATAGLIPSTTGSIVDPFFIVGTERSGSNLLRLMLQAHSQIAVPHPPHFMKNLAHLEPAYGDLGDDANLRLLIDDCLRYLRLHPYRWELAIDTDIVLPHLPFRSLLGVQAAIYQVYCESCGKTRWGCKSTFSVRHLHEIGEAFPTARFVHLVRDPRDVVASSINSNFNHFHPYYIAALWESEQLLAVNGRRKLGNRLHVLEYEELIRDPERQLHTLCEFLCIPFEVDMLTPHLSQEAQRSGSLSRSWRNTSKPIMKDNARKFLKQLDADEIMITEAMCLVGMDMLGYRPVNDHKLLERERLKLKNIVPWRFWCLECARAARMQLEILFTDKNNHLRILKYWFVRWIALRNTFRRILR